MNRILPPKQKEVDQLGPPFFLHLPHEIRQKRVVEQLPDFDSILGDHFVVDFRQFLLDLVVERVEEGVGLGLAVF